MLEHLAHVPDCGWAINVRIEHGRDDMNYEDQDPLDERMMEARRATFRNAWPHEGKRGWKCQVKKMVDAGWTYSPTPDADDSVYCFYCQMALDGWEPKDDPYQEHHRRNPDCEFFALCEQFAAARPKKGRKASTRGSKASRLSTQSNLTIDNDQASQMSLDETAAEEEDTILTTASKRGRKKAAPKTKANTRRKRQGHSVASSNAPEDAEVSAAEHDGGEDIDAAAPELEVKPTATRAARSTKSRNTKSSAVEAPEEVRTAPAATRAASTRQKKKKQAADSSLVDVSDLDTTKAAAKSKRSARNKQPETEDEPSQVEAEVQDASLVSAASGGRTTRGKKRISDGTAKTDSSVIMLSEVPIPPPRAKGARTTRAASTQHATDADAEIEAPDEERAGSAQAAEDKRTSTRTGRMQNAIEEGSEDKPADEERVMDHKADRRKKISTGSARSTRTLSAEHAAEAESEIETPDEERVSTVRPTTVPRISDQSAAVESHAQTHKGAKKTRGNKAPVATVAKAAARKDESPGQRRETQAPSANAMPARAARKVLTQAPPKVFEDAEEESMSAGDGKSVEVQQHDAAADDGKHARSEAAATAPLSPADSTTSYPSPDAENRPPSSRALSTGTIRVPLAASTPKRTPTKSKPDAHGLSGPTPWQAVDLDAVLGPSGLTSEKITAVLSSGEKQMTVEEWIYLNAGQAEDQLRSQCESMISKLESEGVKALQALEKVECE